MTFPSDGLPEPWAVEWGEDRYGVYAGFAVGNVVQRMRWIPPGRYVMGSPGTERGRFDNEVQHEVEIENGFWFGDTAVTQALWEAVIGSNPSCFQTPDRPVEMVSWYDCQVFTARLNDLVSGLEARLPTEAEWEYACRAGTTTATWAGDEQLIEGKFVLWLDNIAWYNGNSVFDESEWRSNQNMKFRQGTHPVKCKAPNPWGLYDILGNVYEYCSDMYVDYADKISGYSEEKSLTRNVRGGSWRSKPMFVRAANRGADSDGANDLGLRLACGG
jgi:formylglycine-generating enzyme required for sulfatase activity